MLLGMEIPQLEERLNADPQLLTMTDSSGCTLLHLAFANKKKELVKCLLNVQARHNIDIPLDKKGNPPLHAIFYTKMQHWRIGNITDFLRDILVSCKLDVNQANRQGDTLKDKITYYYHANEDMIDLLNKYAAQSVTDQRDHSPPCIG